ncbi:MAG: NADH:ubiquinone reductase (Na(+)-transporting) subunit D [Deltaproteobacteria bacterium]|nr:NADH:ubiquinone reductase (Na(+)-transporting) subunit D [Deltaproteobacteria bacterium]MBW1995256.1 NADH:ubiquinone reductase (Na(+)-transporting) subunit D [Deltaproteobacteria bacterium]MBW2154332.1 NADH:ubiquinone reductase (Na(+)-transporting) subunit D [Deltaproteobacteria bacterium]
MDLSLPTSFAAIKKTKSYKAVVESLWQANPISKQILGICSALAVTVQLKTAIVMSLALTMVVAFSCLIISLIRNLIPRNIRIIVEISIIATLVIFADELLKAFLYDVSKQLSVFVGLIITNCIVLGRAEGYALSNPPFPAFVDGLANGVGYSSILIGVAFIRELLGSGKLFGINVIPQWLYEAGYENMGLMLLAPGAFIIIGLFVWLEHTLLEK